MTEKLLAATPCPPYIQESKSKSCCCNCKWHARDFRHCSVDLNPDEKPCICSEQKGWICLAPEFQEDGKPPMAYSGWAEHGLCEMHEFMRSAAEPKFSDVAKKDATP